MATIDDKVVAMSFESSKFEQGVNNTLSALDKLKAALHFPNAGKGLADFNAAAKNVNLGHIASGVDQVRSKLETLRLIGIGVMSQLATQAVRAGANFAKSFTLGPLKQGFSEYTTNLNAIQTILANTAAQGSTLKDVNAALDELNHYSDQTIYNFSEMAKNIGTFTAAGVDLKTATGAIKGIANLAALSGSNTQQASTAMYQLSQAIASGRVSLQDWNSVVNAGMGGAVFQKALANTAVAMGQLKDGAVKMVGPMKTLKINGESFRDSIGGQGPKWLTSDILTKTLEQFTGDLSKAQLKAMGFNDQQIKAIQQTAKTAKHAATEVKTLTGVLDVAREAAGSGWAKTWQIIFGDFGEAKKTFTGLSNAIQGFIGRSADARNKVLQDWKDLGGRVVLIDALKTAFKNLSLIMKPIKDAFHDIFPATTGLRLFDLTIRFKELAEALKPSQETIDNLRRTFRGLFAFLDIGIQLIKGVVKGFISMFKSLDGGNGSFLNVTGSIGDFLVRVDEALKKGGALNSVFEGIGKAVAAPIKLILGLAGAIKNLFSGIDKGGGTDSIGNLSKSLGSFGDSLGKISSAWKNFTKSFSFGGGPDLDKMMTQFSEFASKAGTGLGKALANINWETVFAGIRTGIMAAMAVMLKGFLGRGSFVDQLGKGLGKGIKGSIIGSITGSFKALEGSMTSIQNNLKAKTLKEIAIAIGLLTLSVIALSFVDHKKLAASLTAMTVAFGQLLGAMAILSLTTKTLGFVKLPFIAGSLILLAGAIDVLSIAVIAMSQLSWEGMVKGLGAVAFLLAALVLSAGPLGANSAGMVRAGIGISAIAVGLNLLALAVRNFGSMDLKTIGIGLGSIAAGLVIIAGAMKVMPTGLVVTGAGLIAMSVGLRILANVVQTFGQMDWKTIAKGLGAVGGALVIIGAAMRLMPLTTAITGVGLIALVFSLKQLAGVVKGFSGMSLSEIGKGLGVLAGSLGILAGALHLMNGTTGGSLALSFAAGALALLAPVLIILGKQSWEQIAKGLGTLAGALAILGLAGLALQPTIPALIGLGAALVLIGGGLALAGVGIALIGTGLSAIAIAGPTAVGILVGALIELSEAIPTFVENIVRGLLTLAQSLAKAAPQFAASMLTIVNSLIDTFIKVIPAIAAVIVTLIGKVLQVLDQNKGRIIQAGWNLLMALLQGIKNNISQLTATVIDIISRFLTAIASNINKVITAGGKVLAALLKGIANTIGTVTTAVGTIITKFLSAVASNLSRITTAGISILVRFLGAIASNLGKVIVAATNVIVTFIRGIGNAGPQIIAAATEAMVKFIRAIAKAAVKMADEGMKAIVFFLNGVADAIDAHADEMRQAGVRIGVAIIHGMTGGLTSAAGDLYNKISGIVSKAKSLFEGAKGFLLGSPSKWAHGVGEFVIQGLANGMDANSHEAYNSAAAVATGVITAVQDTLQIRSPSKVMMDLGREVTQGFAQGIRGDSDAIKGAFQDLNNKLLEAMRAARETIATEQKKLDDLRKAKKQDKEAIREAQKIVDENTAILSHATAAHMALVKQLRDEKATLIGLTGDYEKLGEKLKTAQDTLKQLRDQQEQAIQGFQDQYGASPDISDDMRQEIADSREAIVEEQKKLSELANNAESTPEQLTAQYNAILAAQAKFDSLVSGKVLNAEGTAVDQLATYVQSLKTQADTVAAYSATLDQLRKLGLDDATYQKLLKEGPADQAFAKQLLAGGKTAVQSLNTLDANLAKVSRTLATNAGKNLYQAGVDAAEGLVKGLQSKRSAVRKEMEEIAREMIRALKKELGIKSPSQEFAEIGRFSMEGMAKGFKDSAHLMTDALDSAATDALTQMRKTMSGISSAVSDELNPNPVITPVLDLTLVRAQSQELSSLTSPVGTTSYGQATSISSAQADLTDQAAAVPGSTVIKFEQNNQSPKALSEIEIYRQTKNQLSQLRTVLQI